MGDAQESHTNSATSRFSSNCLGCTRGEGRPGVFTRNKEQAERGLKQERAISVSSVPPRFKGVSLGRVASPKFPESPRNPQYQILTTKYRFRRLYNKKLRSWH
jgi:hypothetical protein